jgi:hypothetical protein
VTTAPCVSELALDRPFCHLLVLLWWWLELLS